jgi:hypothetical protein
MAVNQINPPFPTFNDQDGYPLNGGYLYIGQPGFEAQSTPKASFFDVALTIPTGSASGAAVRINGGYAVYNGAPSLIYADGPCSITVKDQNDVLIFSSLTYDPRAALGIEASTNFEVNTFADLVAVTSSQLAVGAFARVKNINATYQRAPDAAVNSHLSHTASPLKWYVQKSGGKFSAAAFGAVGEGLVDDRASIQACINTCNAEYPTVEMVLSEHLISASLVINRAIDGPLTADWFTISGGSITVSTAINIFTSSTSYTTAPVSQTVRFDGVTFKSTNPANAAYILHGARFLRVQFTGCTMDSIKILTDATVYTQSIYFDGCNMRYWTGFLFYSAGGAYDIKVNPNNIIEQGAEGFLLSDAAGGKSVSGCSFMGSVIEGLSGTGIRCNGARNLHISGIYFEGNAGADILLTGGTANKGVNLSGNLFVQTAGNKASGSYASVVWGAGDVGFASGNFSDGRLHTIPATARVAIGNDVSLVEVVHNASANKTNFMSEKVNFGTLNPQTNAAAYGSPVWLVGSIVFNEAAGTPGAWRCTAGGSPGTWVTFG